MASRGGGAEQGSGHACGGAGARPLRRRAGREVRIDGWSSFKPVLQYGRDHRNPVNGERVVTEDRIVQRFKAGKAFKEAVTARESGVV
ncbi:HU family DNA-binding protein [Nonomuraea soli]|uniref:HU family DNA-binding protein n=1 Tax=Nonomuraea soli TaxID=1032476 RepID=UPI0015EC50C5|nr:HU family DNA-binding protein [Nonomuraea soli]